MEREILKPLQKVFYEGERVLIRTEEMEVGLVPPEDMHVLEEIDEPVEEKNLQMRS